MKFNSLKLIAILFVIASSLLAQDIQKELSDLYNQKNYDELFKRTDEFLQKDPNDPTANLIKGRALVDMGKFNEGRPFIENAIRHDNNQSWKKAWGLNYLGLINFMNGNQKEAKANFEDCLLMNATKNVSKTAKNILLFFGLDQHYDNWKIVESEKYIFHFPPNTEIENIDSFINAREEAFKSVNDFFNVTIPKKIDFIAWNNNEDARVIGIPQLGFSKPEYCLIHSRYNQTLGHEITHIISHYYSESIIKSRFINEGISVAFDLTNEDKLKSAQKLKLEDNFKGTISILEAWNNPKKYSEWVYYPFAGEFIKRLLEKGGKDNFLKLVSNQTYESAKKIYGIELVEVINDLEEDINK